MNEGQKTGLFCVIGVVMLAVGSFVAWPTSQRDETADIIGKELFESFKDPLAATSLKMVSFDENQGKVDTFEVRRDRESGVWSIPSRKGYPADAVEQMKNAANALVGLRVLDIQTQNAEDHEALGVVEPKLESLEVGDVGVGRLVTFRDESQKDLAALIIGKPVKDQEGRRYVRKPGQDPVYVVELDEAALSTKFQNWIEDDLLKLSSIDIRSMRIEDYAATVAGRGFSLDRNYTAEVVSDGTDWRLEKLLEYPSDDPLADPVPVEVDPAQVVNEEKLNDIKNALDELKIVDVVRKPEGMSANLRADKDLVSDNEAVQSLVERGFLPVQAGVDGPVELYSANGELNVTLNDGVEYVLRFGNVSGLADTTEAAADQTDAEQAETSSAGVNRYLLVTARVDEEQFPAPELKPVPQSIDELAALLGVSATDDAEPQPDSEEPEMNEDAAAEEATQPPAEQAEAEQPMAPQEQPAEEASAEETPAEEKPSDSTPAEELPAVKEVETEEVEVEVEGGGEASGDGQGQLEDGEEAAPQQPETPQSDDPQPGSPQPETPQPESDELKFSDLTEEEKLERLEAEQEKILKENTRMLDARKDRLNAAKRKVSDLNARFADWYYVIPETTYRELRVNRDELLTKPESDEESGVPGNPIQIPGLNPPE